MGNRFRCPVATCCRNPCRSRIRRCGWRVRTATRSRLRRASASGLWRSLSSIQRKRRPGVGSTTTSSRARSACRSDTASTRIWPSCPPFSIHEDRLEAIRRGQEGFEFFGYALQSLVTRDTVPGYSRIWERFQSERDRRGEELLRLAATEDPTQFAHAPGIGTPDDLSRHLEEMQESGIDQVILMQQAGRNRNEHICEALELFAAKVLPRFTHGSRQARSR